MKKRNLLLCMLFLLAPLSGNPIPAGAAETMIGEIVECAGKATLRQANGAEQSCAAGLALRPGNVLRTGADGRIQCRLRDGGTLRLGPNSELAAEEAALLASEEEPLIFRLTLGVLRAVFPTSDSAPEVHTPTAVIGVRGTAYEVAFALDTETAVAVDEGTVSLERDDRESDVATGQRVEFSTVAPRLRMRKADSPDQRNWPHWRRRREKNIAKRLTRLKPLYEKWRKSTETRLPRRAEALERSCRKIQALLKEMETARERGDRRSLRRVRRKFRKTLPRFRREIRQTRRQYNRLKSVAGHCHHIGPFLDRNPNRFSPGAADAIRSSAGKIMALAEGLEPRFGELRDVVRKTVAQIQSNRRNE